MIVGLASFSSPHRLFAYNMRCLCDELDDTASLLDLALGLLGNVAGLDDDGDLGNATLAEDLGVAERKEVKDGGVATLLLEVLLALLGGDEGPELVEVDDGLPELLVGLVDCRLCEQIDRKFLKMVVKYQEKRTITHADLSKVTGMVLIHVGPVVVLTTGQTTTTGVLPVLADTTVTGGDVTAL